MQPHERRIDTRKAPEYLAYLSLPQDNGGIVTDISAGGVGFRAIAPLKMKGPIEFRFSLDSSTKVKAVGEVAWIDDTGKIGGLRFTELPEEVREKIRLWISESELKQKAGVEAKLDDVQVSEPPAAAKVASAVKAVPVRARATRPLLYSLRPPVYSAPFYEFSMFPLPRNSKATISVHLIPSSVPDPISIARNHPVAAVGLTIALALIVSIGIFAYVSSLAGESFFDWSERVLTGAYAQSAPRDITASVNFAANSSSIPPC